MGEQGKRPSGRSRQAAKAAAGAVERNPNAGRLTEAVALLIDSLDLDADLRRSALAEVALTLASGLDAGAGMAAAAMAKELRATLAELGGDDADDDDAFAEWERQLGFAS